ncbi:MAG: hypothetical protein RBR68_11355 [Tenuifilaceae bacterium]|nr:hypothetical protein [Tenuifilaceae bacterium]
MLKVKKVIILKNGKQGSATIVLSEGDSELIINKVIIDLNNGSDPIKSPTFDNTPIVSGDKAQTLFNFILKVFNKISDTSPGLYEITSSSITKLGAK